MQHYLPLTLLCLFTLNLNGLHAGDGTEKQSFQISDLEGKTITHRGLSKKQALVIFFVTTDCPIANSYQPAIDRIYKDFRDQGFVFAIVHEGPEQSQEKLDKHIRDFSITIPVARDVDHKLAYQLRITKTPEVCVISDIGETLYQGRIDDLYPGFGKKRNSPTREDLLAALAEIAEGKPVSVPKTTAVGCSIARLPEADEPSGNLTQRR